MPRDTILDAWCKGYSTARDGAQAIENPYPEGTKLAEVWTRARQKSLDAAVSGLPAPPLQVGYYAIGHKRHATGSRPDV